MNDAMYEHPATQANLETLRARGVTVLEPGTGALGSPGECGVGRLPEPPELLAAVEARLGAAGGAARRRCTCSSPPAARASRSTPCASSATARSGRMGFALAEEAARRGATVTVVAANVSLPRARRASSTSTSRPPPSSPPPARERFDALRRAADGRRRRRLPAGRARTPARSRRTDAAANWTLAARAYRGRADRARRRAAAPASCWSASPPSTATARSRTARDKLERKSLDAVVVNDISRAGIGFDATDNEVTIVTADGERHVPRATKAEVARAILDAVLSRRSSSRHKGPPLMEPVEESRPDAGRGRGGRDGDRGRARVADNIRRAVKVRDEVLEHVHRRAARRGPHPRRGLPGRRQDRAGARAVALDRLRSSRASSARPTCCPPTSSAPGLQPARGALRVPPRPDLRQRRDRRRGQPRVAEDAVRPARVHAGAARHRRRALARAGAPVPRLRDPEPGRVRGHLPAARGAGRPLHGPARRSATRRRRAEAGMLAGHESGDRVLELEPVADRAEVVERRTPRTACTPRRRCATTSSRCCATRATTTASSSAPRRAPA